MTKPLTRDERQLAEVTARCIATAETVGLRDTPEKLVPPHTLRLLARAHLELLQLLGHIRETAFDKADLALKLPLDQRALHAILSQKLDSLQFAGTVAVRVQNIFENIGIRYVGELVQLDKRTLLRQKHCGKTSLRAIERVLAEQGLHFGMKLEDWPGPRWRRTSAWPFCEKMSPQLVPAPADPADPADPVNPAVAHYCQVMGDPIDVFLSHATYIVRQWDGMDGCWTDCTGEVDRDEALRVWADRTDGGTRRVTYAEIDYYRIFPGNKKMLWDGSEGQEMHR